MKQKTHRSILILAVLTGLMCSRAVEAQVVNFDVPGGAGAANYSGQGAYPDPGNNYWNPIVGGGTTGATNRWSNGATHSPITLTSQLGGTYGTAGTQGTAGGITNNLMSITTVCCRPTPSEQCSPPVSIISTFYGINNTGTRGTIFTVIHPRNGARQR